MRPSGVVPTGFRLRSTYQKFSRVLVSFHSSVAVMFIHGSLRSSARLDLSALGSLKFRSIMLIVTVGMLPRSCFVGSGWNGILLMPWALRTAFVTVTED